MDSSALDKKIRERGKEFFASISGEAPSIFNKGWWTGKVMDWAMKNEDFKVQMFRFVDVLPYLNTGESLSRHIEEYFGDKDANIPDVLKWGAGKTGFGGGLVAPGGVLRGFELAGADGVFHPATARIAGETVEVSAAGVAMQRAVRYGWANVPEVNLFNAAGLPASPFRAVLSAPAPQDG